ncbi:MAG: ABC transporter ATP-binding protein [Burkholderiales bacterium]|nr:ABC transporter ATP-binding protein [Burkholderiales bacterium]
MPAASLRVRDLTKRFSAVDGEVTAVDRVSFDVAGGEFFTMVGASGCGKTTTLRMIAGLEPPTSGTITMGERDFVATPAQQRNIGMVFQSYALFPHLTIFENVAYGLRLRGVPRAELERRVSATLALLKLEPYMQRHPAGLSGGQQQRVSIARALVYEPELLLLDEPLANLDAKLRVQMREELRALQRRLGITAIYVTHDQEEATAVSDRIAVFDRGRLIQQGAPETIYAAPATLYVADFIGRANFLPATLATPGAPQAGVLLAGGLRLSPRRQLALAGEEAGRLARADDAIVMLRPEHLSLAAAAGDVACRVLRVELLGGLVRYRVEAAISPQPILVETTRPLPGMAEGAPAWLSLPADDAIVYHR